MAILGARLLVRRDVADAVLVPVGVLAFGAIMPVWIFQTSGFEEDGLADSGRTPGPFLVGPGPTGADGVDGVDGAVRPWERAGGCCWGWAGCCARSWWS